MILFSKVWFFAQSPSAILNWGANGSISTSETNSISSTDNDECNESSCLTSNANGRYGALSHDQPSLTAGDDYQNQGIWTPLRSCLMYLSIYLLLSVVAYSYVFESWTIIDSIYFGVATFTTVGYGDLQPTTTKGQLFTIFFAIYGVIILGVFIGIFGHSVSKAQARVIKKMKRNDQSRLLRLLFNNYSTRKKMKSDSRVLKENFIADHQMLLEGVKNVCYEEYPQITLVMILAFIIGFRESWSFTSTLYFCIMSASTTGFGDYTPKTQSDKLFCIFFFPVSVAVFGEVLGKIAAIYMERKYREQERNFLKRAITRCDLNRMDADDDGNVDLGDFLSFMLVALQKVDQDSIDELKEVFHSLDTNGNGFLDKDDLIEVTETSPLYEIQVDISEKDNCTDQNEGVEAA